MGILDLINDEFYPNGVFTLDIPSELRSKNIPIDYYEDKTEYSIRWHTSDIRSRIRDHEVFIKKYESLLNQNDFLGIPRGRFKLHGEKYSRAEIQEKLDRHVKDLNGLNNELHRRTSEAKSFEESSRSAVSRYSDDGFLMQKLLFDYPLTPSTIETSVSEKVPNYSVYHMFKPVKEVRSMSIGEISSRDGRMVVKTSGIIKTYPYEQCKAGDPHFILGDDNNEVVCTYGEYKNVESTLQYTCDDKAPKLGVNLFKILHNSDGSYSIHESDENNLFTVMDHSRAYGKPVTVIGSLDARTINVDVMKIDNNLSFAYLVSGKNAYMALPRSEARKAA